MSEYSIISECWNKSHTNVLKESVGGAVGGAAVGGAMLAFNEWLMHWIKELKQAAFKAETPQELKEWYDTNIVDDDAIYWTRKGYLKMDYFSRAINMMAERNDPDFKRKMVSRCNKYLMLNRVLGGIGAGYTTLIGATM